MRKPSKDELLFAAVLTGYAALIAFLLVLTSR